MYPAPVPILGVNVGQLGYLTELEPDELEASLPRLLAGDFEVSERMMLAVDVESAGAARGTLVRAQRGGAREAAHRVTSSVSTCRSTAAPFTTYAADGVIVATPTGTTAYSFSARRSDRRRPTLRCLVLTPVSPHMLFDRSLVLAEHEELAFVVSDDRDVVLTIDGRELGELVLRRSGRVPGRGRSRCGS